jgi:hypothetical protein
MNTATPRDRILFTGNRTSRHHFRQKYEDEYCHTKNRFLYTGNRTSIRHFRQKDEYCHTRDRFLFTRNRSLRHLPAEILPNQRQVSVHRKQNCKTSLPAEI